jgi:hypothetical protein
VAFLKPGFELAPSRRSRALLVAFFEVQVERREIGDL